MIPLASIPSPSDPFVFQLGGFQMRWYGLILATGIVLAAWLTRRELRRRGYDPDIVYQLAEWVVPGGVIGARLYHVATDWGAFQHDLPAMLRIWEGGLGMPGAIAGGVLGGWIAIRRHRLPFAIMADCIAPGLLAGQVLGRWGNWFNQELYGGPTTLPWGLEIDPAQRPARYAAATTFQPTFLYESLWNLALLGLIYLFVRRRWRRTRAGGVFALYLAGYALIRVILESVRVDPAQMLGPFRFNQLLFTVVFIGASAWFAACLKGPGPVTPASPAAPARRGRAEAGL